MIIAEDTEFGFDDWSGAFYLFNCAGYERDGDWWHNDHNHPEHKYTFYPVDTARQFPRVLSMIKHLNKKGRKKARMIIVGPHVGIALCLEGIITPEHMTSAKHTKTGTESYIDILYVRVPRRKHLMTIRVVKGDRHRCEIANGKGKAL